MKFRTFVGVLFVVIIIIFSFQNAEVIDVKFFIWKLSISRVLVILGSFVIGIVVGILLSLRKKSLFKS
tara:strand:+ start:458 stop:661 length:204 start_codon:yes stop_codon:yes gene_type:complete